MFDVSNKGAVTRYFGKSLTADMTSGYLASVKALRELLKVRKSQLARSHSWLSGLAD